MKKIVTVVCSIILLTGCTQRFQQGTSTCTDIQVDVDQVSSEYDFSPFLEDGMKVIKLETDDSCLVSKIGQFAYVDNVLYIAEELEQTVYLFDSNGKFLKRIGKKGQGPGEYSRMGKFQVKGDQIYILDEMDGARICVYDIPSGKGTYLYLNGGYQFEDFHIVGDDMYLICNNRRSERGYYNLIKVNMNSRQAACFLPFDKTLSEHRSHWGLYNYVSQCDDELLMICSNNDTIYQINSDNPFPQYSVRFSKRTLPKESRTKEGMDIMIESIEKGYIRGLDKINDFGRFFIAEYSDNTIKSFIYNKDNGTITTIAEVLTLNKWGNLYMWEYVLTDNKELVVVEQADMFKACWEQRYSKGKFASEKDREKIHDIYKRTKEEDNPIVYIFKLKE